jgi:hypothetical protein
MSGGKYSEQISTLMTSLGSAPAFKPAIDFSTVIDAINTVPKLNLDIQGLAPDFGKAFANIKFQVEAFKPLTEEYSKIGAILSGLAPVWTPPKISLEIFKDPEWEKRHGESVQLLALHGWFISIEETPLHDMHRAAGLFKKGLHAEGHAALASHFKGQVKLVQKISSEAFPHRERILDKAFDAHDSGNYDLSIPALFSQADGIGHDIFGVSIYSKRGDRREQIRKRLGASVSSRIIEAYREIVTTLLPINADTDELSQFVSPLNRNGVMHGLHTDYGTEINALKAVSWLQYVCSFKTSAETIGIPPISP